MLSLSTKRNRGILLEDIKGNPVAIVFQGDRLNRLIFSSGPLRYTRTEGMECDTLREKLLALGESKENIDMIVGVD